MITYGSKVNAETTAQLLDHLLGQLGHAVQDERPTPVCIWGLHGIGKTELVRDFARARNCDFVYIAPAQFEEMGDLIGMPRITSNTEKGEVTRFAPPEWVPVKPGPGILLLDDVNRADDRILRGIMQLLQYYELASWRLPANWLIVLTANPDGGDYSVTTLDDAMLTRMLHVTMEFDVNAWARWAEGAGVDERGINFVLTYPELVNGRRTTPRSLVQFFQAIRPFESLRDHLHLVKLLGDASLDEETTQAFINFIHLNLDRLPSPDTLLETADFEELTEKLNKLVYNGPTLRLDIISVLVTRLSNYLLQRTAEPTDTELERLSRIILLDFIPNDLRLAFLQELTRSKRPGLQKLAAMPAVGELLLKKM